MIASLRKMIASNDSIVTQNDSIVAQNDSIVNQNDSIVTQNDSIVAQNDSIVNQNDSIVTQNDSIDVRNNSVNKDNIDQSILDTIKQHIKENAPGNDGVGNTEISLTAEEQNNLSSLFKQYPRAATAILEGNLNPDVADVAKGGFSIEGEGDLYHNGVISSSTLQELLDNNKLTDEQVNALKTFANEHFDNGKMNNELYDQLYNDVSSNTEQPIQGNENQGNENQGNENQGNENQGNENQGNENQGNENQGNENQGNENQGNENQGNENQGNENQGNENQGNENQGNENQGNENQGNENQGNENQGNDVNNGVPNFELHRRDLEDGGYEMYGSGDWSGKSSDVVFRFDGNDNLQDARYEINQGEGEKTILRGYTDEQGNPHISKTEIKGTEEVTTEETNLNRSLNEALARDTEQSANDENRFGNENQGNENQGNENQGNENQGNENQGNENQGNENQGNENQGNENQGNENQGNENQGNENQGNENQGNENQGNENQGNENQGNENQGNENQGNENQGNENKGNDDTIVTQPEMGPILASDQRGHVDYTLTENENGGYRLEYKGASKIDSDINELCTSVRPNENGEWKAFDSDDTYTSASSAIRHAQNAGTRFMCKDIIYNHLQTEAQNRPLTEVEQAFMHDHEAQMEQYGLTHNEEGKLVFTEEERANRDCDKIERSHHLFKKYLEKMQNNQGLTDIEKDFMVSHYDKMQKYGYSLDENGDLVKPERESDIQQPEQINEANGPEEIKGDGYNVKYSFENGEISVKGKVDVPSEVKDAFQVQKGEDGNWTTNDGTKYSTSSERIAQIRANNEAKDFVREDIVYNHLKEQSELSPDEQKFMQDHETKLEKLGLTHDENGDLIKMETERGDEQPIETNGYTSRLLSDNEPSEQISSENGRNIVEYQMSLDNEGKLVYAHNDFYVQPNPTIENAVMSERYVNSDGTYSALDGKITANSEQSLNKEIELYAREVTGMDMVYQHLQQESENRDLTDVEKTFMKEHEGNLKELGLTHDAEGRVTRANSGKGPIVSRDNGRD